MQGPFKFPKKSTGITDTFRLDNEMLPTSGCGCVSDQMPLYAHATVHEIVLHHSAVDFSKRESHSTGLQVMLYACRMEYHSSIYSIYDRELLYFLAGGFSGVDIMKFMPEDFGTSLAFLVGG